MKTIDWVIRSTLFKGISGSTDVSDNATDAEITAAIQSELLNSLSLHWPYRSGDVPSDGPGHSFTSLGLCPMTTADSRDLVLNALIEHFKAVVSAGSGMPFHDTKVEIPTKAFEGYANAVLAALPGVVPAVRETCEGCGHCVPCDEDCPNHIDEPVPAGTGSLKPLYIKRFRTLIMVGASIKDEVKALLDGPATTKAEVLREALVEIESWRNDTLGARPKVRDEFDCAPEITEAFDRGVRMAFYRCAERAKAALASPSIEGQAKTPGEISREFHAYWDAHQKCPEHSLITENAANVTWHAAYAKYAVPATEGQAGDGEPVAWRYGRIDWEGKIRRLSEIRDLYFETPSDWVVEPLYSLTPPERKWINPIVTIADLVNNLLTLDQTMEVHGAYFIDDLTVRERSRTRSLSLSRERVANNRVKTSDESLPWSLVIWTAQDERAISPVADRVAVIEATALARRLCQLFDSGGESQRSARARHASAIFQLLNRDDAEFLAEQAKCDADPVAYLRAAEDRALPVTTEVEGGT
jgi:hypothetical protein